MVSIMASTNEIEPTPPVLPPGSEERGYLFYDPDLDTLAIQFESEKPVASATWEVRDALVGYDPQSMAITSLEIPDLVSQLFRRNPKLPATMKWDRMRQKLLQRRQEQGSVRADPALVVYLLSLVGADHLAPDIDFVAWQKRHTKQ